MNDFSEQHWRTQPTEYDRGWEMGFFYGFIYAIFFEAVIGLALWVVMV
jgi:hypothetical protein